MSENIQLEQIRRDGGTQSRAGMNGPVVYEYADLMKEGATFPDITVFFDGKDYWLADGYHRHAAAVEAGLRTINADVKQGTQRDAVLFSVGANSAHGLRRTNDDKRRAVTTLLQDEEWAKWSDREIARRTGVHHTTVGALRTELSGGNRQIERVVTRGGTTFTQNVRHWGLINGMGFWSKVDMLGLDKGAVIGQLQKGANALTDLTCTRDEAFQKLNTMALEALAAAFPVRSFLKHTTGKFGRVNDHDPLGPVVDDLQSGILNIWKSADCTLSTEEEWRASFEPQQPAPAAEQTPDVELPERQVEFLKALAQGQLPNKNAATRMALRGHGLITSHDEWERIELTEPGDAWLARHVYIPETTSSDNARDDMEFSIGDRVKTPTGHAGEVCDVVGRNVDVRTINGTKTYHAAFLTLLGRAGEPVETPPAAKQPVVAEPLGILPWTVNPSEAGAYLMDAQGRPVAHVMYSAQIAQAIIESMNSKQAYQSEAAQKVIPAFRRVLDYAGDATDAYPGLLHDVRQLVSWLGEMDELIEEELKGNREQVS